MRIYNFTGRVSAGFTNLKREINLALPEGESIKSITSEHIVRENNIYINWGYSTCPSDSIARATNIKVINRFNAVHTAVNKLRSFREFENAGIRIPEYYTRAELLSQVDGYYLSVLQQLADGVVFVGRFLLEGSMGRGISIITTRAQLQDAVRNGLQLLCKYVKKRNEYRFHIMKQPYGSDDYAVLDVTEKRRNRSFTVGDDGRTDIENMIRSHSNGWVFCRDNIDSNSTSYALSREQAIMAVDALGLDFGAVDVIYNQHQNRAYVLEVNTAPGLEGTTLERYKEGMLQLLNSMRS